MVKNAVMTHCPRIARDNYTPLRPSRHPLIVRIVSVPEDPSYVAVGRDPRPSLYIPFAHLLPPSPLFPLIYRLPLIFQFCPPISSLSSRFRERATDRSSSHRAPDNRENFARRRDHETPPSTLGERATGGCVERACRSSNPPHFFSTDFASRACPRPSVYSFTSIEKRGRGLLFCAQADRISKEVTKQEEEEEEE